MRIYGEITGVGAHFKRPKRTCMNFLLKGAVGIGLILLPFTASGQRYLTGELSGVYPADDYIITGNIHVLPRTSLRFEPGTTLRFENFTGIVVRGKLICKGTILRPIRFTSSRDILSSPIMPESFDWNGIKITPEASMVCLEFCTISYSTTGVEIALKTTPVILKEVTFHHNGSNALIREREQIPADENVPVSYQWLPSTDDSSALDDSVVVPTPNAPSVKKAHAKPARPPIQWKKPVLCATGGLTIAGGLFSGAAYGLAYKYSRDYRHEKDPDLKRPLADKRDNWLNASAIGLAVTCVSAVGFTLTYIF
jgi:hypothetical protein